MKRLVTFAVTVLTALCMFSCSAAGGDKTTAPNGLNSRFQTAATIVLDELTAEGTVKRFGDGAWEVEFSSPNTLSGVKLSFSEGSVSASYKGLNFSVPQSALPVKAMMLNLMTAVDDLAKRDELTGSSEDGKTVISGTLDGGDYTLTVDKSGNISSFEMPNNKLKITFAEVTAIAEENTAVTGTAATTVSTEQTVTTTTVQTAV